MADKCQAWAARTNSRCKNDAIVDVDGDGVLDACKQESHQRQVRERKSDANHTREVPADLQRVDSINAHVGAGTVMVEEPTMNTSELGVPIAHDLPEELEVPSTSAPSIAELQALSNDLFKDEPTSTKPASSSSSSSPSSTSPGVTITRGKWTPQRVKPWLAGPVDLVNDFIEAGPRSSKPDNDTIDDDDVDLLAEAWAPAFDDFMSKVDPNNPYGAAFLTTALVLGPKMFGTLRRRIREKRLARGPQLMRSTTSRAAAPEQPAGPIGAMDDIEG
jgi:hypothetical protein